MMHLKESCLGVLLLFSASLTSWAASRPVGTTEITFDHYSWSPGSSISIDHYYESGFKIARARVGDYLGHTGGQKNAYPFDGSPYIQIPYPGSLRGEDEYPGLHFGLYSVDISEWSVIYDYPMTVEFIGYRADGMTVTNFFTTDGIIDGQGPAPDFETFRFDEQFADIVRFEVFTTGWAMDNLVVSQAPEPGVVPLVGLAILAAWWQRRNARS